MKIIFFDSDCLFCNKSVLFIHKWLKYSDDVYYSPLKGKKAEELRGKGLLIPKELNEIIFVDGDKVYLASSAIKKIIFLLRFPFSLLIVFNIIPSFILNLFYYSFAKIRLNFSNVDNCSIPTKDFLIKTLE